MLSKEVSKCNRKFNISLWLVKHLQINRISVLNNPLGVYMPLKQINLTKLKNDWPKYQEQLNNLHSAEICQIETQIVQKDSTTNTHTAAKKNI